MKREILRFAKAVVIAIAGVVFMAIISAPHWAWGAVYWLTWMTVFYAGRDT